MCGTKATPCWAPLTTYRGHVRAQRGGLPGWAVVLVLCPLGCLGCEALSLIRAYCRVLERAWLSAQNVARNTWPCTSRPRRGERYAGRV